MRKFLLAISLITSLITYVNVKAQVYSDVVYNFTSCPGSTACTGYVQNPQFAADPSQSNYATLFNGLGVGSSVVLEYGFSVPAQGGSLVGVTLQKGNQTLSAGLLSNITVQLYNSAGVVVGQRNGLQLQDLGLLSGTGNTASYVVSFFTPQGSYNIQRVRITLGGTLNVLNDIRVYNAFYLSPSTNGSGQVCGLEYATNVVNSGVIPLCVLCSVTDAGRAVDADHDNYATMTTAVGLLGAGTYLRVNWATPGNASQYVGFIIGDNNTTLSAGVLSSIEIDLLNAAGTVVHTHTGFSAVDLTLLSGSTQKKIIGFYAPVNFTSARLRVNSGLLTALNSTRVYDAIKFDATPDVVQIATTPLNGLCSGDSVTLTATAGYDKYFWSTGDTTQSITVYQSGTYTLTALDADACLYYSEIVSVTINALPVQPIIANITANPTILCNGASAVISVISPFPHTFSTGQTDSSITLTNSGTYFVTVTDTNGCVSASDTLTIIAETAMVNIISTDTATCEGTAITLIASGNGPVTWSTGIVSDTLVIVPAVNGTVYTAYVQTPNGCVDSASVTVQVKPLPPKPTISGLPSDTVVICNGATQTFTITPSSGTYTPSWSDGTSGNSIDISAAGNYYVTVMDSVGCSRTSDTLSILTQTAVINITSASGDSSAVICYSPTTSFVLNSNANGSVLWSTGDTTTTISVLPTASTSYAATVTTPLGCTASDNFALTVNPLPTAPVIDGVTPPGADSLILCNGATADLSVSVLFANTVWSTGDTTNNITVSTAGDYFVTIQDLNGCSVNSDTISVFAQTAQVDLFSADTAACAGNQIIILVTANGPVLWNDGSTGTAYFANPTTTTTYTATVTTSLNCQDQVSVTVTVSDSIAYATAQNDNGFTLSNTTSPEIDLATNDTYTGNPNWLLLSGPYHGTATINGSIVTYTPNEDYVGLDSIRYVVCGTNGCGTNCDTAIINIEIIEDPNPLPPVIRIPGGISPNGDGTNDGFVIDGLEDFPNNQLTILNRWGDVLYTAKPYHNDWDGTAQKGLVVNSQGVPDGTYYYVLILGDGSKPVRGFIEVRK